MLRGASIALTVTFTAATTLPPSSTALGLDFDAFESGEIPQDSPDSSPELNDSCNSSTELNASEKVDKGGDLM